LHTYLQNGVFEAGISDLHASRQKLLLLPAGQCLQRLCQQRVLFGFMKKMN
jgi:hypothetical protein